MKTNRNTFSGNPNPPFLAHIWRRAEASERSAIGCFQDSLNYKGKRRELRIERGIYFQLRTEYWMEIATGEYLGEHPYLD